jgi:hypothetical protein
MGIENHAIRMWFFKSHCSHIPIWYFLKTEVRVHTTVQNFLKFVATNTLREINVGKTVSRALRFPKLISRKIWVAENSSNSHTVILVSSTFHFLNFLFNEVLCCGNRLLRSGYANDPITCSGRKIAFF